MTKYEALTDGKRLQPSYAPNRYITREMWEEIERINLADGWQYCTGAAANPDEKFISEENRSSCKIRKDESSEEDRNQWTLKKLAEEIGQNRDAITTMAY